MSKNALLYMDRYTCSNFPGFWVRIIQISSDLPPEISLWAKQAPGPDGGQKHDYLLLYIDDIVLTASSSDLLQQIITSLHAEFSMTNLGSLNYFLSISVTRNVSGMFLSQQKYATEVLDRAGMLNCKPCRYNCDNGVSKLSAEGAPILTPTI
ncbi:ribonuclease H-like domain-containing protein [Tanacetum coccineum]